MTYYSHKVLSDQDILKVEMVIFVRTLISKSSVFFLETHQKNKQLDVVMT